MAHGAGGQKTSELIGEIFKKYFDNPHFTKDDAAVLARPEGRIAMSTDGFIVSPAFFPGGNIGELAVSGTVNDLSCMGAEPLYLTCSFIIEEGFLISDLEKIAESMADAAKEAGIEIVAGDTKVAGHGQADGVFITTAGVGVIRDGFAPSGTQAKPGDAVLVTGDIGRHGCAILLTREEEFGISADVKSDVAPLWNLVSAVRDSGAAVHTIRDATRGGVGTVLYEISEESNVGIRLDQTKIPVDPGVAGVCGMLGLDPLYLANEGRLVIFCPKEETDTVLDALRSRKNGEGAAVIGEVTDLNPGIVTLKTEIGSETILPKPGGELLPRIC
ncbi:MAG: hydrogenase expression/formation protein HypE [Eubacteriales bacterium]|nr:hydrogenase expression/formation protein HypE [Eubacteriales bacterium]